MTLAGSTGAEYAWGVAADPTTKDVYLAGSAEGSVNGETFTGNRDWVVIKLDADGVEQWTYQVGWVGQIGQMVGTCGNHQGWFTSILVEKFWGSPTWRRFPYGELNLDGHGQAQVGENPSYGSPYGIAVDSGNNVIVAGNHQGSFFGTAIGNKDIVVIQLNSAGVLQWAFQFGSTSQDQANCVTIDSSGNIIVGGFVRGTITGHTFQGGEDDAVLIKLDSGGSQVWVLSETLSTSGKEWVKWCRHRFFRAAAQRIVSVFSSRQRFDGFFTVERFPCPKDSFFIAGEGRMIVGRQSTKPTTIMGYGLIKSTWTVLKNVSFQLATFQPLRFRCIRNLKHACRSMVFVI